jgi:ABC-2 type transport system ATP-binding protein
MSKYSLLFKERETVKNHVSVKDVSKNFGKQEVLKNISMEIEKGEIFGLLGPSGAGKTTLVKMIAGIETTTTGSIHVLDVKMPNLSILSVIGYMAQSDALYSELSAIENLEFFASIYGLKGSKRRDRISEVMEIVNLTNELKKPVGQFSGGMKRRLSLGAALLHEPKLLILDEPTVGIDPVLRQSIWKELKKLSQQGITIIVTTHVMDEAEKCDRLGMIREGALIAVGTPEYLKNQTGVTTIEKAFLQYGGAQ